LLLTGKKQRKKKNQTIQNKQTNKQTTYRNAKVEIAEYFLSLGANEQIEGIK
jgi:hypothetical protein